MSGLFHLIDGTVRISAPNTMTDEESEPLFDTLESELELGLLAVAAAIREAHPELTIEVRT